MQITMEQLDQDIQSMNVQLEQLKAQTAQTVGALLVLHNMKKYLSKTEEELEKEKLDKLPVSIRTRMKPTKVVEKKNV